MQKLLKSGSRVGRFCHSTTGIDKMLAVSCLFSISVVGFRVLYTGAPTFLFLVWNLFLACIPYLLTRIMMCCVPWVENNLRFAALFAVWLLFLPNTFYILTDLFHLEARSVPLWFDLVLIFSFAWSGLVMGIQSVQNMELMLRIKIRLQSEWLFVFPVMGLNALGIYIGRYLRYNSWDVITNPWDLTEDMVLLAMHPLRNRFDWSMILCYTLLLSIVYVSIKRMKESR